MAYPTARRDLKSRIEARYSTPSPVSISVRSDTHRWLIPAGGAKSRSSRSAGLRARRSALVNPRRFFRGRATRPWPRIESATVFLLIRHPACPPRPPTPRPPPPPPTPAVATLPGSPISRDPVPKSAPVDPQLPGHLRDRLPRLPHDPHRPGPELLIKLPPRLGHLRPPS